MAKKSPLKKKEARADALWSLAVRARDGRCLVCGKTTDLHAHHWCKKRGQSKATRWNLNNGITMCAACHLWNFHQGPSKEFLDRYYAAIESSGLGAYQDEIIASSQKPVKYGLTDVENLIYALETILKMH